jgi:ABC-2 type transport system ATP-binding protein
MKHAMELRNLKKQYKGFILEDVSFAVPAGFISGLIGPNGAGKTTIIKSIMNLIHADSGQVTIFGDDAWTEERKARSRIGYVSDEPKFYEDARVGDHATAFSGFYESWNQAKFTELADEYELPVSKKCKTLSQGMRTKLAIALALAHEPDLLIMDEPTSGLDPIFRKKLLASLAEYVGEGGRSVLFSTHITSDLETTADFVTFIHDGRVMFSESLESVHDRYSVVKGSEPLAASDSVALLGGRTGTFGFEALTPNTSEFSSSGFKNWVAEPATLEDIMYFTKREESHDSAAD